MTANSNEIPGRENRGLKSLVSDLQQSAENSSPGEKIQKTSIRVENPPDEAPAEIKAVGKLTETAGKLATEALRMEEPEEETEDQMISTALEGEAKQLNQQQQALDLQRQEQERMQKMMEERKKKQEEIDRRKRLRLAAVKQDSLVKKAVKDQLNPLDVGLMSTPFGVLWGMVKIPKWIGKILP